jgi:hypothetical protein
MGRELEEGPYEGGATIPTSGFWFEAGDGYGARGKLRLLRAGARFSKLP